MHWTAGSRYRPYRWQLARADSFLAAGSRRQCGATRPSPRPDDKRDREITAHAPLPRYRRIRNKRIPRLHSEKPMTAIDAPVLEASRTYRRVVTIPRLKLDLRRLLRNRSITR